MKKVLSLTLAVLFAVSMLSGCGSAKKTITVTKEADLQGLNIGVQAGTTGESYANDTIKKKNAKTKVSSYKTAMDAALDLKNGGIDAIVLDQLPAESIVSKNSDLKLIDLGLAKEEYAIAVKKGNKTLLASINATIKKMKDNGSYTTLVNTFMPTDGKIKLPADITSNGDKKLNMGTNAAFPPFEYKEGGNVVGFDATMGQQIAADYGAKLTISDMNFDALIPALSAGQIDFIAAGLSVTPERQKNVDFSDPYYSSSQMVIVRK